MADRMSPEALKTLLTGNTPFAFIDVREAGEYNTSHIPGSSLMSRRHLEFQFPLAVPYNGTHVILCDDDGRRVPLAAATVERMGYRQVSVLDGGINRWVSRDYPTEWGSNVPSKDFGEKVEVVHHVPELEATELHERMARGDKLVILDTRTPEEYQRFCIPGGRSAPGGELALRITDITKDLDPDTTIIVNCAGRTRSIIGTRVLQRMGIRNVYGLKNGTWFGCSPDISWRQVLTRSPSPRWRCRSQSTPGWPGRWGRYLDIAALKAIMAEASRRRFTLLTYPGRVRGRPYPWFPLVPWRPGCAAF
jgi:rhodanese-related sulfurtransferase